VLCLGKYALHASKLCIYSWNGWRGS
jgi:hypothetical protein